MRSSREGTYLPFGANALTRGLEWTTVRRASRRCSRPSSSTTSSSRLANRSLPETGISTFTTSDCPIGNFGARLSRRVATRCGHSVNLLRHAEPKLQRGSMRPRYGGRSAIDNLHAPERTYSTGDAFSRTRQWWRAGWMGAGRRESLQWTLAD